MMTYYTDMDSPVGPLTLASDGSRITGLYLEGPSECSAVRPDWRRRDDAPDLVDAKAQLEAYFRGDRTSFTFPLSLEGTPFQRTVWEELLRIPYGTTISYGELAARIGNPKASRAVGLANGKNPIAIVVPCHRVIGADGSLTGYGGGMKRKKILLDLERGASGAGSLFELGAAG